MNRADPRDRTHRPTGRADERGLTLVELIIAMALSIIVVTAAAGFLGASQKAQVTVNKIDQSTRMSSTVMTELGRMLRAATENPEQNLPADAAFIQAGPSLIRFYAFVNLASSEAKPVMVQFQVTNGQLVETQWSSTPIAGTSGYWLYSYPNSPKTTILADAVATSNTSPFTFYGSDGTTPLDGSVQDNLDDIRYVKVNLEIGSTTVGAYSNVVTTTTIVLPNVLQENAS